jgi:hypothetical protein
MGVHDSSGYREQRARAALHRRRQGKAEGLYTIRCAKCYSSVWLDRCESCCEPDPWPRLDSTIGGPFQLPFQSQKRISHTGCSSETCRTVRPVITLLYFICFILICRPSPIPALAVPGPHLPLQPALQPHRRSCFHLAWDPRHSRHRSFSAIFRTIQPSPSRHSTDCQQKSPVIFLAIAVAFHRKVSSCRPKRLPPISSVSFALLSCCSSFDTAFRTKILRPLHIVTPRSRWWYRLRDDCSSFCICRCRPTRRCMAGMMPIPK